MYTLLIALLDYPQNEIDLLMKQLDEIRRENKSLKRDNVLQTKQLDKFQDQEGELPQLMDSHNKELRSLKEQIRSASLIIYFFKSDWQAYEDLSDPFCTCLHVFTRGEQLLIVVHDQNLPSGLGLCLLTGTLWWNRFYRIRIKNNLLLQNSIRSKF